MSDTPKTPAPSGRLDSLDAYRGFIMMALVSFFFGMGEWLKGTGLEEFGSYQTSHVPWTGCSLWDLIQPSFMFIVGIAMPFSYASRRAQGDSQGKLIGHAIRRALTLILLGVFLRSNHSDFTYWTFEDVISQIGLGYVFVFLTLGRGIKVQAITAGAILVGYWILFAFWPLPEEGFSPFPNGDVQWEYFSGFAAHWNKGANPMGYFDAWFLNLFPRIKEWGYHPGGYGTLSFIPSMATMLFGVMTGEFLRGTKTAFEKFTRIAACGCGFLVIGLALDGHIWFGVDWDWSIVPIVKRIWTPSFAIFSTGWTLLMLSAFILVIDVWGFKKWAFPFFVVGMNPLTIYVLDHLIRGWIIHTYKTHVTPLSESLGSNELVMYIVSILVLWGILFWMYRKKLFIRI
ncbi:MAG: DUF5009 domain-containing protein [Candidatus Hydrogenedentota bacterium]